MLANARCGFLTFHKGFYHTATSKCIQSIVYFLLVDVAAKLSEWDRLLMGAHPAPAALKVVDPQVGLLHGHFSLGHPLHDSFLVNRYLCDISPTFPLIKECMWIWTVRKLTINMLEVATEDWLSPCRPRGGRHRCCRALALQAHFWLRRWECLLAYMLVGSAASRVLDVSIFE